VRISTSIAIAVSFLFASQAGGQATQIRVLCSNGLKAVVEELKSRAELQIGRPLAIEFGTSVAIRQRIQSGETFDVAILSSEVLDDLIKAGKIGAGTRTDLGRSGIGIGVRSGARKPDIATIEALKTTILNAKSMTWVDVGASRVHIDKMLGELGIAKDVQPKIILTQQVDQSIATVAGGKADLIITLISEIVPAKGVDYVGPLPPKVQNYVSLAGGIGANSKNVDSSRALIKVLSSSSVAAVYKSKGMELVIQGDTPTPAGSKQ
jgi:molybdate transport system substrate-binding protein